MVIKRKRKRRKVIKRKRNRVIEEKEKGDK